MTSYAMQVRNSMLTRIQAMTFFINPALPKAFTFTKNRALQVQPDSLPLCGVYFLQEVGTPEGDPNAGEIRFSTTVRYGFTVILENNDMEEVEDQLDDAFEAIRNGLFSDPTFYGTDEEELKIEGFTFSMRRHNFGTTLDQETPFAELQWELVCDLGVIDYPPVVEDPLTSITITTAFPIDGTEDEQDDVQQVRATYELPQ